MASTTSELADLRAITAAAAAASPRAARRRGESLHLVQELEDAKQQSESDRAEIARLQKQLDEAEK